MSFRTSRDRRRTAPLVVALYVNAGLLACLLVAVLSRNGSTALAAPPAAQPIAGGDGLYVMPGQFSSNVWGCYVMDTQRRALCAYEYLPGQHRLQFVSARFFENDLQLREFNTGTPTPREVERLIQQQNSGVRGGTEEGAKPQTNKPDDHADRPGRTNPGDIPTPDEVDRPK